MNVTQAKLSLIGKWFASVTREGTIKWWGQVLAEVNVGKYLVRDNHDTKSLVLVDKMGGWRFFDTQEELSKAMDEINARTHKREGGATNGQV